MNTLSADTGVYMRGAVSTLILRVSWDASAWLDPDGLFYDIKNIFSKGFIASVIAVLAEVFNCFTYQKSVFFYETCDILTALSMYDDSPSDLTRVTGTAH